MATMDFRRGILKNVFRGIAGLMFASTLLDAHSTPATYPCQGSILTYFKRPTVISGACPVPRGKFTLDAGTQYNALLNHGSGWTYPQTKIRIGLPALTEVAILFPNENTDSHTHLNGTLPAQIAVKHALFYHAAWNTAVRVAFMPKSGSQAYGAAHPGGTLSGILAYTNQAFNMTFMGSIATLSAPSSQRGVYYTTLNPDLSIGWFFSEWLEWYGEIYGQSKTIPNQKPGFNLDTGLLYLFTKNIAADLELGHRLTGTIGNFNTYYGGGLSILL